MHLTLLMEKALINVGSGDLLFYGHAFYNPLLLFRKCLARKHTFILNFCEYFDIIMNNKKL